MNENYRIYLVLISFEVLVEGSSSLKMKRGVINRIRDRIRSRYNASVAEIGYLDKWQRAAMGASLISNDKKKLQKDVDAIQAMLVSFTDLSINHITVEWL